MFDLAQAIKAATEQWKLTHPINAAPQSVLPVRMDDPIAGLGSRHDSLEPGPSATGKCSVGQHGISGSEDAAPLTFADLQLGDEFICPEYDDIVWEKRERGAICQWNEGGKTMWDRAEFKPTDKVERK